MIERGYTCTTYAVHCPTCNIGTVCPCANAICHELCGDGILLGAFACDDGNLVNGDGCSDICTIEAGWDCSYGSANAASFCWPLFRPLITDGSLSDDDTVVLIELNVTAVADGNLHFLSHLI